MSDANENAQWNVADWVGTALVDRDGHRLGKLQDVYVDIETDAPQFATVKEGVLQHHLCFVPLGGAKVGPHRVQVSVTKEQVKSSPQIKTPGEELSASAEALLYHHFELNYTPVTTERGRRLARR